jgi:hypothetical protein
VAELGGGDEVLGHGHVVVGHEDDLEDVLDLGVRVHDLAHGADQVHDLLGLLNRVR